MLFFGGRCGAEDDPGMVLQAPSSGTDLLPAWRVCDGECGEETSLLSLAAPCSSADPQTAHTAFDEREAACRDLGVGP